MRLVHLYVGTKTTVLWKCCIRMTFRYSSYFFFLLKYVLGENECVILYSPLFNSIIVSKVCHIYIFMFINSLFFFIIYSIQFGVEVTPE